MKLLLLALLTLPSWGDFVPGRVRASAEGVLQRFQGEGIYESVADAKVVEFVTDGKGVTHYLVLAGGHSQTFLVTETRDDPCHTIRYAVALTGPSSWIRLEDASGGRCSTEFPWKMELRRKDGSYSSRLSAGGVPEHFVLTW